MLVQKITGTALLSAGAFVIGTKIKLLGARYIHTTDANCVIKLDSSSGVEVATLKVTDEKETDTEWFDKGSTPGFPCTDVHVIAGDGSVYIYFE